MQATSEPVSAPFDFRSDGWLFDPAIQGPMHAHLAAECGMDTAEVRAAVLSALFAPEADPTSMEEWTARVRAELRDQCAGLTKRSKPFRARGGARAPLQQRSRAQGALFLGGHARCTRGAKRRGHSKPMPRPFLPEHTRLLRQALTPRAPLCLFTEDDVVVLCQRTGLNVAQVRKWADNFRSGTKPEERLAELQREINEDSDEDGAPVQVHACAPLL